MSGAPKRLHEEGSHSTPTKRPLDDSSLYLSPGKVIQSSGSDFHGSFEHDGRFAKIQRVEPRDDKRPSVPHRMPVGSSNFADHPISSDSRLESKQNKDARDNKADDRETKADARDVHSDSRIEFQANKIESDVKVDNRADESEIRSHPIAYQRSAVHHSPYRRSASILFRNRDDPRQRFGPCWPPPVVASCVPADSESFHLCAWKCANVVQMNTRVISNRSPVVTARV